MVVKALVCTVGEIDGEKKIVNIMKMSWDQAIEDYHGKRCNQGFYYVACEGDKLPYPVKRNPLKNIIYHSKNKQD